MTNLTHPLDEIKRVTQAATEGPWTYCLGTLGAPPTPLMHKAREGADADGVFIALARTALPELVAEVERLREDLEAAHEAMDHNLGRLEDLKNLVDGFPEHLDEFMSDELRSVLDDDPCPPEGFQYVSKRAEAAEARAEGMRDDLSHAIRTRNEWESNAEAAEATIERVRKVVKEIDGWSPYILIGAYGPGIRDDITEKIDAALDGTQP